VSFNRAAGGVDRSRGIGQGLSPRSSRRSGSRRWAAVFLEKRDRPAPWSSRSRAKPAPRSAARSISDALTDDKGDATTYIDLIRHNLRQLASALVS